MEIKSITADEAIYLTGWLRGDEQSMRVLVGRYQKMIFAMVQCLTGCGRDAAYEITVSSFTEAANEIPALLAGRISFLSKLVRRALENTRKIPSSSTFDLSGLSHFSQDKAQTMRIIKEALFSLTYDNKVLLLLRDQMNLPYDDIAETTDLPKKEVKSKTALARVQLRDKIQGILNQSRGGHGL